MNRELRHGIGRFALQLLDAGALSAAGLPAGVRALDLWSNGRYGSVLFWVDRELDISSFGHAVLLHHNAKRLQDGEWCSTSSGGMGVYEPELERILVGKPRGLLKLGGGSQDPLRVTIGIASQDVAAIRLRDETSARERPLGADGFFLLGITYQDPITYAYAVDADGKQLPGESLLL